MHFIRIITATTKSNKRTKKVVKKPSKPSVLEKFLKKVNKEPVEKPTKKLPKISPKKNLTKNNIKNTKPTKTNVKTRNKQVNKRFNIKPKISIYPLQDESLPTFQELLDEGYDTATFVAHPNACSYCKKRNGMKWRLKDFISNLQYDAPIFEKAAHVNAQSSIKVSDSKGELEDVYVNYNGDIS